MNELYNAVRVCPFEGHDWEYKGRLFHPKFECQKCGTIICPTPGTDDAWAQLKDWDDPYATSEDVAEELDVKEVELTLL